MDATSMTKQAPITAESVMDGESTDRLVVRELKPTELSLIGGAQAVYNFF